MAEKILGLELCANELRAVVIKKSFNSSTLVEYCGTPYPEDDKSGIASTSQTLQTSQASKTSQASRSFKHGSDIHSKNIEQGHQEKIGQKNCVWKWDAVSFEKALALTLSELDLKGCSSSVLCLPASLVSFRTLKVPFASENRIRQILPFELAPHLPTSNATDYLSDFIFVNKRDILNTDSINKNSMDNSSATSDNSSATSDSSSVTSDSSSVTSSLPDENHIFTASLPVKVMDICVTVLKKHGIEPSVVTSQGVVASIFLEDAVIVEVTRACTVISVVLKKNVIAVRSFSGRKNGVFIKNAIHQILAGLHHRYGIEIIIRNRCILSDETCPDITDAISVPGAVVHQVNIADHVDIGMSVDLSANSNNYLFNATASALFCVTRKNCVNFCQGIYARASFFHEFKDKLAVLAIFASIFLVALFSYIQYDIFLLQKQVSTLDNEIVKNFKKIFPEIKTVVEPLMQMQVKVREAEKTSGFTAGKKDAFAPFNIRVVDILYELSSRIPENVDLDVTRFLINEGRVVMGGSTDNFNTVDKMKTMIEKYDRFKSVTINSATADKNGNRVMFNFIIELNQSE
ncbi:MAG: PilN domain-containing protein [Desulfamplus sp.]|nr:PilN domain-containing protein [Desulfamplus sp.]